LAEEKKRMTKEEYFKEHGEEWIETGKDQFMKSGWPEPTHFTHRIVYETYKQSIEEAYYWLINYARYDVSMEVIKVTDIFAASEHSAFFGVAQQRIGLQQDKVTQFMATIGKMIKDMFQLVREIRILDERLSYYDDSYDLESKSRASAEITLKGIYIDMAEGGAKSPASVYGMARELQFTTLPDIFFSTHPSKSENVDEEVDKLDFNRKVKEVLKRKLRSFLAWKEHTYKEIKWRRIFTLKYLRQHVDVIKMYMNWVRPYLRNIKRMQSESLEKGKERNPDIASAFEGSVVELEFIGRVMPEGNEKYYACGLIHFNYRTRPSMNYTAEGYQRGPLHVGETRISFREYAWTEEQIQDYIKMREQEDFELVGIIDKSVTAAMEALGDDLYKYLEEAGEIIEKKEGPKEVKQPTIADPFTSVVKGFGELFLPRKLKSKQKRPSRKDKFNLEKEKDRAIKTAQGAVWLCYKNYKKAHKMFQW